MPDPLPTLPNAVLATNNPEVRDFLTVHLGDRGFAVAVAEGAAELARFTGRAALVIAEFTSWKAAGLHPDQRGFDLILLSPSPTSELAILATEDGALDFFEIPFTNPRRLARTLDEAARRAHARAPKAELEPVS